MHVHDGLAWINTDDLPELTEATFRSEVAKVARDACGVNRLWIDDRIVANVPRGHPARQNNRFVARPQGGKFISPATGSDRAARVSELLAFAFDCVC
jgi:hypothetical protein